jgi:TolA-binding protein
LIHRFLHYIIFISERKKKKKNLSAMQQRRRSVFVSVLLVVLLSLSLSATEGKAEDERGESSQQLSRARRADDVPGTEVILQQHSQRLNELTAQLTSLQARLGELLL